MGEYYKVLETRVGSFFKTKYLRFTNEPCEKNISYSNNYFDARIMEVTE